MLTEKQILTTIRLSDMQKVVLTKIIGAANPQVAAEQIANGRNLVGNRDILAKLGLVSTEEEGTISVTDSGNKVMKDENLIDDSGQLTSDGQQYAAANDADDIGKIKPGGTAEPDATTKPDAGGGDDLGLDDDLNMGGEEDTAKKDPFESQDNSMLREINQQLKESKLLERMQSVKFTPQELALMKSEEGDMPDDLMDKIYEFVVTHDPSWMPYGTQKARDGDPHQWIYEHLSQIVSAIESASGK